MTKHQEQVANRQLRAATLLMDLCDQAGVSRSPSEVRQKLASILGSTCSQRVVRDLTLALNEAALFPWTSR